MEIRLISKNQIPSNHGFAFTERARLAELRARQAVYDLHTTYLSYTLLRTKQEYTWVVDYHRDEEPSNEDLDRAAERADEIRELFIELYMLYHAYRRFATDVLGVDLETWFALHPNGPAVLKRIAETVDEQMELELAEKRLNEEFQDKEMNDQDDLALTLDELADQWYDGLVAAWDDGVPAVT